MTRSRLPRLATVALAPLIALTLGPAVTLAQAPPASPPATTTPATPTTPAPPSDTPTPAPVAPQPAPPTADTPATPAPTPPPASATTPATPPATQTADPFGEEVTLAPKTALIYTGKATWDSAFESLTDAFKSLSALLDKQGIRPAGNPMIVYTPTNDNGTSTDDNGFVFQAEIPVDQEPKDLPKSMAIGKSPEGKALKFVHRGSYDNMDNTYEAITNHLDDKGLEARDLFIEEYLTDPLKTAEDKLVINVYVPLK